MKMQRRIHKWACTCYNSWRQRVKLSQARALTKEHNISNQLCVIHWSTSFEPVYHWIFVSRGKRKKQTATTKYEKGIFGTNNWWF